MSNGMTWLRCIGCGHIKRFAAHSGGDWGLWESGDLTTFMREHLSEACHQNKIYDRHASLIGYQFFDVVTEASPFCPTTYGGTFNYERIKDDGDPEKMS